MAEITMGALQEAVKVASLAALQEYRASQAPVTAPKPAEASKAAGTGEAKPEATAKMGAGVVETIDGFRVPVLNIALPLASAIGGLSVGSIAVMTIDTVVPARDAAGKVNFINPVFQLAAAGLELKFLPGKLGMFAAGSHLMNLALRYTPLSSWIAQLEGALAAPLAGLAPKAAAQQAAHQAPMANTAPYNYSPAPGFASPAYN